MKKENLLELEKQECLERSVGEKGMLSGKSRWNERKVGFFYFSRKGKHGFVWVKLVVLKEEEGGGKSGGSVFLGKGERGR